MSMFITIAVIVAVLVILGEATKGTETGWTVSMLALVLSLFLIVVGLVWAIGP